MPDSPLTLTLRPPIAQFAPVTWTVMTIPPSRAERFATRTFRLWHRAAPWWMVSALGLFYIGVDAFTALTKRDMVSLRVDGLLALFIVVLAVFLWERQGFCELVHRYDAELRDAQSPGRPPA